MTTKNRAEIYADFLKFIQDDSQKDRMQVHQQMFSTLLWCFLVPVSFSIVLIFFIRFGMISHRWKTWADISLLAFPLIYSLYYLGSQVLVDVPLLFRKGGLSMSLRQIAKEGHWRHQTTQKLSQMVKAQPKDWEWIVTHFKMDLRILLQRTRFLILLGGVLFYILSQSFDIVDHTPSVVTYSALPVGADIFLKLIHYISSEFSAVIALVLFLTLLYLTGTQLYHSLHRYLDCAELLAKDE